MFSLKEALGAITTRNTPEVREEMEQKSADLRARLDPNSADSRKARARQHERSVLEQIAFLQTLPDSDLKTARLNAALDRLGELYSEQGLWEDAAAATVDPKRQAYYESMIAAIERPNNEFCECPPTRAVASEMDRTGRVVTGDVVLPTKTTIGTIVTENGLATVERCAICGFTNANAST